MKKAISLVAYSVLLLGTTACSGTQASSTSVSLPTQSITNSTSTVNSAVSSSARSTAAVSGTKPEEELKKQLSTNIQHMMTLPVFSHFM